MTPKRRQQALLLAVVVIGLAGAFWFNAAPAPATSTPAPSNSPGSARSSAGAATSVADLRLERLNAPREEMAASERNPFRFQQRAAPAPARPVAAPPRVAVLAPPVPTGPPPPPPIALKFIGILDLPAPRGRVAMLSDGRGNTFYGKEGDIIEGRYQVLKIGTESADIAYVDGRGRQTIRLSGQ